MDGFERTIYVCLLIHVGLVDCFLPHDAAVRAAESLQSRHHGNITTEAVSKFVDWFLMENTNIYPVEIHDKLKNTTTFKGAMNTFKAYVGKYDLYTPFKENPSYHFTAEKFTESNLQLILEKEKVINAIKNSTFDKARKFAASVFHTVQDFYSSSDWIEMGNQMSKEDLGTTVAFRDFAIASPTEKTCDDCQPLGECYGNIRSEILAEMKLTSGYYSKHDVDKPAGKCGYGGFLDEFKERGARGGINKDTLNPLHSPHHYLHLQAANLAVQATVNVMMSLYQANINQREIFGEFLGLESANTLCFVIDTTGSMSDEIATVKDLTIRMTRKANATGKNFVLVPVNDPDPGIIHITDDADEMIKLLGQLVADGGGDAPEMSMSGMLLAAQNVRFGSTCWVFTDAEAKDKHLKDTLKSVVALRKVTMEFKLTLLFRKKKKRSVRVKRAIEDDYKEIAEASGGSITKVRKGELKELVKVIEVDVEMSKVFVSIGFAAPQENVTFYVDSTMKKVIVQLSTESGAIASAIMYGPSGKSEAYETISSVSTVKLLKITEPETGQWMLNVQSTGIYSYRVYCETIIDFTYILLKPDGVPVEAQPVRGVEYDVSLQIYGSFNPDSLFLLFVAENGSVLKKVAVDHFSTNFIAKSILPSEGFYFSLRGLDNTGKTFQRVLPLLVRTTFLTLDVALTANDTLDVKPGSSIVVKVKLSNEGVVDSQWNVNIFDSSHLLTSMSNLRLTVAANESDTFALTFAAREDEQPGQVSTVTVSAHSVSNPKIKNSLSFYVSIIPKKSDLELPTCSVLNITYNVCKESRLKFCNATRWRAEVMAQDLESGLHVFIPSTTADQASFSSDKFETGTNMTVRGTYESNCCHLNATIIAVDGNGNVGRCQLRVPSVGRASSVACPAFIGLMIFLATWL